MRGRIAAFRSADAPEDPGAGSNRRFASGETRGARGVRAWMPVLVFVFLSLMVSALLGAVIVLNDRISAEAWDCLRIVGSQVFTLWLASGYHYTGVPPQPGTRDSGTGSGKL